MTAALDEARKWSLFEVMLRMRRFEEAVFSLHDEGAFTGHYHLYIGQEAAGAAAMSALGSSDHIVTTHRNHGHLIARGADPAATLAEILGRATGINRGYGGTFHLCEPELGFLSTSGVVGGAISLAIGGGYACRQRGDGSVTIVFFGDGALEEGVAFEALNIAALWNLPVVFFCENNDAALWQGGGKASDEHATDDLRKIPATFGIETERVDGRDVEAVFAATSAAVAACRGGNGPRFIESMTERWPGNFQQWPSMVTGVTDIVVGTGRAELPAEHRDWFENQDPVLRLARSLAQSDSSRVEQIDGEVLRLMNSARELALAAPEQPPEAALNHVFA
ncbi:MAG: hypothetical protein RLZ98_2684 [Pseudomonadota bacterium]|jgi:pyruvate dehydrogenase E1 component alpha subunit